jgi:HK97 family phage portal protein
MSIFTNILQYIQRTTRTALTKMRHRVSSSWSYWPGVAQLRGVRADQSGIVVACVRWIQRNFTDAPVVLQQWDRTQQGWITHAEMWPGSALWLLTRPNGYYSGITLFKGLIADRILNGISYVVKVRSTSGNVVELWWAPAATITPMSEGDDFITYYRYTPNGGDVLELRYEDVIRLPDGMDPLDPRLGNAPVQCLLREVMTDEAAASMTATLLENLGVPGIILSPKQGSIPAPVGQQIKRDFMEKTTGSHRGEPLVLEGQIQVDQFGFSPQELDMRSLRGIPEERITAVLGVNAAVVGLGVGLTSTHVGATLKEYREEAFESTIIPLYREIATELTNQLLGDFMELTQWRVWFDLSQVRVLQEDENAKSERIIGQWRAGLISRSQAKRELGYPILPEDEVYVLSRSLQVIPVGTDPEDQQQATQQVARPVGRPEGSALNGHIRALLGEVEVPA